ncbi:MAG: hypothetical protein IJW60_06290 [Clostridia bacterium]|nr:hypothetical protein [Clostridia bacterium]
MSGAICPVGRDMHGVAVRSGNITITPTKSAYRMKYIAVSPYRTSRASISPQAVRLATLAIHL